MREIKFRGKRVDNGEFAYGDLIHGVNHKSGKIYILPVRGGVMALGHGLDPLDGYEVIPETVGQYTGLKDKNGKDIYEGDIVKFYDDFKEEHSGEIVFHDCMFGVFWDDNFQTIAYIEEPEIIGDIYTNPELLTQ